MSASLASVRTSPSAPICRTSVPPAVSVSPSVPMATAVIPRNCVTSAGRPSAARAGSKRFQPAIAVGVPLICAAKEVTGNKRRARKPEDRDTRYKPLSSRIPYEPYRNQAASVLTGALPAEGVWLDARLAAYGIGRAVPLRERFANDAEDWAPVLHDQPQPLPGAFLREIDAAEKQSRRHMADLVRNRFIGDGIEGPLVGCG